MTENIQKDTFEAQEEEQELLTLPHVQRSGPEYNETPLFPTALCPAISKPMMPWEDPRYSFPAAFSTHSQQLAQQQYFLQNSAAFNNQQALSNQAQLQFNMYQNIPSFKPSNFVKKGGRDHSNYLSSMSRDPNAPRLNSFGPVGHGQRGDGVWKSVYSNIEVYEFSWNNITVMRRHDNGWVNATHMLKVAGVDKGKRTKLLDKELQGSISEKIQGGYGRYQGTWYVIFQLSFTARIPLERARQLAEDYNISQIMAPLFDLNDLKN